MFMKEGLAFVQKYMKFLLDSPPKSVVDFVIDSVSEIMYTFLAVPFFIEESDPNQKLWTGTIELQQLNQGIGGMQGSREWLVHCLQEIPINIFTADEKERLIRRVDAIVLEKSKGQLGHG